MKFNEYIPQGGWLKFNARRRAKAALANAAITIALTTGFVAAYWLVAILELG